jgi:type VI protein secretion system component VasK
MNLSDDLIPAADPTSLLRMVRRRRHLRLATRVGVVFAVAFITGIGLWRHPADRRSQVAMTAPASPAPSSTGVQSPPVTMTRDELIDSLKDQTYALIRWPDGREQLLIRR